MGRQEAGGTLTDLRGNLPVAPRLRLRVFDGPDEGATLMLDRGTYRVGSGATCALVLHDRKVSREHLELEVHGHGVLVRDLGSKNGSYYQGARFTEVVAGSGAVFLVGASELRLVDAEDAPAASDNFFGMHGAAPVMHRLFEVLARVSPSDATVLLEGETGTGKERCAEAIHAASHRKDGPFVICDLAGVVPGLIESDLFGHRKGAFTGADEDRDGAFVRAHRGTIFLDEIGELPLALQTRLLRTLDQRTVQPVGSGGSIQTDVRVIAATNRNLRAECAAGRFRTDLYHRLAVVKLVLPPLRDRKADIPALARSFMGEPALELPPLTLGLLSAYDWPGNVRELHNVVTRALALVGDGRVLLPSLFGLSEPHHAADAELGFADAKEQIVAQWERAYLSSLLASVGGNVADAARKSGLQRTYLHRLLRKHGLRGSTSG